MARIDFTRDWLQRANDVLPRTQSDPGPVTSVTYALARLRHHGPQGECLRREMLDARVSA